MTKTEKQKVIQPFCQNGINTTQISKLFLKLVSSTNAGVEKNLDNWFMSRVRSACSSWRYLF